ncbi:hypothetical protein M427DRAFT_75194 [Gonapodya prolifera JEL478]|uniref:ARM repeat-containing protein n=1 Tax=Gonapodya prolifera (strain JEL478) TaxID=1344416 RepID=A0A138ZYT8_GONPJ|nr:hypothetical protein M427DRAFT_75194 [Gonapodya prolifera JEL478]|eukprot:KXS09674.1 hypothetical protein M427DRAFT_75194 [Gonapodya prolifera JEL478]
MALDAPFDWNRSLPYLTKQEHDLEVATLLDDIKTGLAVSLLARDYAPGGTKWIKQLERFLDLKFPLSRDDRVKFVQVLYEVVVNPNVDPPIIERYAECCAKLLAKEDLLPTDALELDWQPMWNVMKTAILPKQRERSAGSNPQHIGAVVKMIKEARRYFPPSATVPILSTILPYFTQHNIFTVLLVQGSLALFLPTHTVPTAPKELLNEEGGLKCAFFWVPTVLDMMKLTPSLPQGASLELLSRLAKDQVGKPDLVGWTKEDVAFLLTATLREMELPVGTGQAGASAGAGGVLAGMMGGRGGGSGLGGSMFGDRNDQFESLARLLVNLIYPSRTITPASTASPSTPLSSSGGSVAELDVLDSLKTLLQSIESYYHPSNGGKWSRGLNKFLHFLAREFLARWRRERLPCTTPGHLRLTRDIRDEFTTIIKAPALLAIFGKDSTAVNEASSALKCLAWLAPNVILPPLLELLSSSISSTEATQRVIAAIDVLSHIAPAFVSRSNFPRGAKYLLELLDITLPGLDINDPRKSTATLRFITHVALYVPFADATKASPLPKHSPTEAPQKVSLVEGETEGDFMLVDVETRTAATSNETHSDGDSDAQDDLARESTTGFEDWVVKFLDRAFQMLDNLPQNFHASTRYNSEDNVLQLLVYAIEVVFGQLSPDLHCIALERVYRFARERTIVNATKQIGVIASLTGLGWGAENVLDKFLPTTAEMIQSELESGAGSQWATSEEPRQSDITLHWWQSIAHHLVQNVGPAILRHRTLLDQLMDQTIRESVSARAYQWSAKLLRHTILSLTGTYPNEVYSLNPNEWNDANFASLRWGATYKPSEVEVNWHTPSQDELAWAKELIKKWSSLALGKLTEMMAQTKDTVATKAFGQEFVKWIVVLRNVIQGVAFVQSQSVLKESSEGGYSGHTSSLSGNHVLNDAEIDSLFSEFGVVLHKVAEWTKSARPDDVECGKAIIKAIRVYVSDRGMYRTKYFNIRKGWRYQKDALKAAGHRWEYPRYIYVMRLYLQHLNRLRVNGLFMPLTETSKTLVDDLVDLSLTRYPDIRNEAFGALLACVRTFPSRKYHVLPKLFEALKRVKNEDTEEMSDRVKGALNLINTSSFRRVYTRDWEFRKDFTLGLIHLQHIEKPQIQDLIRKVFVEFTVETSDLSIRIPVLSENTIKKVRALASTDVAPTVTIASNKVVEKENRNLRAVTELGNELIQNIRDPQLHWRFHSMAVAFLELQFRDDSPLQLNAVKLCFEGVTSEVEAIRGASLPAMTRILYLLKKRSEIEENGFSISREVTTEIGSIELQSSDWTASYLSSEKSRTSSYFSDKTRSGWYCWPRALKVYKYSDVSPPPAWPYFDPSSNDSLEYLATAFADSSFWTKFASFISQEVTGRDGFAVAAGFNVSTAKFFKSTFEIFEDRFVGAVRPTIAEFAANYQDKNKQRAAAEMLGGLVRGSKHWSSHSLDAMWSWVGPLVQQTLQNCTVESTIYWDSFLRYVLNNRDPKRVQPILNFVLSWRLDANSQSFFTESKKLYILKTVLNTVNWRLREISLPAIQSIVSAVAHPYKQVRDALGTVMNELLQLRWSVSEPSPVLLLKRNLRETNSGPIVDSDVAQIVKNLLAQLDGWRTTALGQRSKGHVGPTDYGNAAKTVLNWQLQSLVGMRVAGTYPYVSEMLPQLFLAQDFDDQDLQILATVTLSSFGRLPQPPWLVTDVLAFLINQISSSESWHVRSRTLPLLQVVFFQNLFLLTEEQKRNTLQAVSALLTDSQLEVRQLASVTLSGMLRLSSVSTVSAFECTFATTLSTTKGKGSKSTISPAALVLRHSAVLGLSAIVQAFPYGVPDFVPDILVKLANTIGDPAPIGPTSKKALSNFKRTHHDTWHEDVEKFTPEQLDVLSDFFVGENYYA